MGGSAFLNDNTELVTSDVIETFDSELGSWAISGAKLPRPMMDMRAVNIDGRVLIFGNYNFIHTKYHKIMCT